MNVLKKIIFVLLVLFLLLMPALAEEVQDVVKKGDLTLKIQKLSDKVIVLKEDSPLENNIVAISSKKGLVVIDTSGSTITAVAMREIIEKMFKRKDFAYVINTHHHHDHAFGNQVFAKTGPVLYFFTFFDHPIVNGPSHPGTACLKNPALTGQKVESY